MNYTVTELIEPDNGCEGFMPGEEPMVTLILAAQDGTQRTVKLPDILAYRLKWDTGTVISGEDIGKYCV